ncbi:hypothetical protein L7F22_026364 [Adiantum nelumboides]|nr:hypothetical protein [Adiantum nelumboides]
MPSPEESKPTPSGRGRGGGGRGGAPFYQPRQPPPHKGEKDIPEGAENCLVGSTFVISGTLDSLEREEAEDLIKRHGGRVTTSISKKTSYLLADEDIGGPKSERAKELGVPFLTEDALFDMIRCSKPSKRPPKQQENRSDLQGAQSLRHQTASASPRPVSTNLAGAPRQKQTFSPVVGAKLRTEVETEAWPQKYSPKNIGEIIGNQSIGQPDPMAGVQPAVKAALTKAYKQRESDRRVRSSDLLSVFTLSGQKKLPKKRTRLQITPVSLDDNELGEDDEELGADVEEDESNGDELAALEANEKLELNLQDSNAKAGKQRKASTVPKKTVSKEANSKPPAKHRKT